MTSQIKADDAHDAAKDVQEQTEDVAKDVQEQTEGAAKDEQEQAEGAAKDGQEQIEGEMPPCLEDPRLSAEAILARYEAWAREEGARLWEQPKVFEQAVSDERERQEAETEIDEPREEIAPRLRGQDTHLAEASQSRDSVRWQEEGETKTPDTPQREGTAPKRAVWGWLNGFAAMAVTLWAVFWLLPRPEEPLLVYKGTMRKIGEARLWVWKKSGGKPTVRMAAEGAKASVGDSLMLSYAFSGKESGYPYVFAKQKQRIWMLKPWSYDADRLVRPGLYACCTEESQLEIQLHREDRGTLEVLLIISPVLLARPRLDREHLVLVSDAGVFSSLLQAWLVGKQGKEDVASEIKKTFPYASYVRQVVSVE